MVRIIEQIERQYDEARVAGTLSESGAMPLIDSETLVAISVDALKALEGRVEEVERELDHWKLEYAFLELKAQGYTDDDFLSPEDLDDEGRVKPERRNRQRADRADIVGKTPKLSLADFFGGLFARRARQVG